MRKPYDPRDSLAALSVSADVRANNALAKAGASPTDQAQNAYDLRIGVSDLLALLHKIDATQLAPQDRGTLCHAKTSAKQLARAIDVGLLQAARPDVVTPLADALPDLNGVIILLVDSAQSQTQALHAMLVQMGARVICTKMDETALARARQGEHHLAIVDIEAEAPSGMDVIAALRADHPPHPKPQILALSSFALRGNRARIIKAGAQAVLQKPLRNPATLGAEIIRLVTNKEAAIAHLALPELDRLCTLAGSEMQQDLLFHLEQDLLTTERGLIFAAAGGPDWPAMRSHSHVLIALAGTLGATPLFSAAKRLNAAAHTGDDVTAQVLCDEIAVMLDLAIVQVSDRGAAPSPATGTV